MKVFNEEPAPGSKTVEFIIIIGEKEARALIEMVDSACDSRPKKTEWRKIKTALSTRLCCY